MPITSSSREMNMRWARFKISLCFTDESKKMKTVARNVLRGAEKWLVKSGIQLQWWLIHLSNDILIIETMWKIYKAMKSVEVLLEYNCCIHIRIITSFWPESSITITYFYERYGEKQCQNNNKKITEEWYISITEERYISITKDTQLA